MKSIRLTPIQLTLLAALLCLGGTSAAENQAAPPASSQGETMQIAIGQHRFSADLADTIAAVELRGLLPLTLAMEDYLRNEKHAALPRALSRNDSRPGRIEAGDIMLWSGNTLVVFYESFDSSYSYTRLGKIRDTQSLKAAVGAGNVEMRFTVE